MNDIIHMYYHYINVNINKMDFYKYECIEKCKQL